jgi:hypothetical protein
MNWQTYHSCRVFDEFLKCFVLERKSYITTHEQTLDFDAAFADIHRRYVLGADESEDSFDEKVTRQFGDADLNTRLVFSHAEYLWCMPPTQIRPETKRSLSTLCPNCHYLAHYLLRKDRGPKYKKVEPLLTALQNMG